MGPVYIKVFIGVAAHHCNPNLVCHVLGLFELGNDTWIIGLVGSLLGLGTCFLGNRGVNFPGFVNSWETGILNMSIFL